MQYSPSFLKKSVVLLAVGGLGFGLVGSGVRAAFTDAGSATQDIKVGKLACTLSSTDPAAVISPDGHTVTVNLPDILSSASGNSYTNFTLTNSGSIPTLVHWTIAPSGTIEFQPTGRMGYTTGSAGNPLVDVTLAPGANHAYDSIGFQWAPLTMADLGNTASVAYTANCGEVPPPAASHIQFVGASSMGYPVPGSTTTVTGNTGPAGSFKWVSPSPSDPLDLGFTGTQSLIVASTASFPATGPYLLNVQTYVASVAQTPQAVLSCTGKTTASPFSFTNCTTISGIGYVKPTGGTPAAASTVKGAAATLALPTGWQPGDLAVVLSNNNAGLPAGFTQLNGNVLTNSKLSDRVLAVGDGTLTGFANTSAGYVIVAVYRGASGVGANTYAAVNNMVPLVCRELSSATAAPMVKTDGSSWVGCMAYDSFATTNVATMGFPGTTARVASPSDIHTGLSDTNAGVPAWTNSSWQANYPSGHSAVTYSFELLSA